jgi:hypothetical protein
VVNQKVIFERESDRQVRADKIVPSVKPVVHLFGLIWKAADSANSQFRVQYLLGVLCVSSEAGGEFEFSELIWRSHTPAALLASPRISQRAPVEEVLLEPGGPFSRYHILYSPEMS